MVCKLDKAGFVKKKEGSGSCCHIKIAWLQGCQGRGASVLLCLFQSGHCPLNQNSVSQNITCRECQIRKRSPKTTVEGSKVFVLWEHTYHFFSTKSLLNKRLEIRVTPAAEIKDRVKHTPSAFEMQITVWLSTVSMALYLSWVQWEEYEIVFEYSPNGVLPFVGRVWKSFWGGAACHQIEPSVYSAEGLLCRWRWRDRHIWGQE